MAKNKKYRMTVEELRAFEGFEYVGDKEAKVIIDTLEKFSMLLCELFIDEQRKNEKKAK